MVAATLWIEITMAGLVYLLAALFILLPLNAVADLKAILLYKDIFPYACALFIGASYITGMVMHRVTGAALKCFKVKLKGKDTLQKIVGVFIPTKIERDDDISLIWQFGSNRIHREIDFHYGAFALIRSLLLSVPLLGITSSLWLIRIGRHRNGWQVALIAVFFWIICHAADKRQVYLYGKAQDGALRAIDLARKGPCR